MDCKLAFILHNNSSRRSLANLPADRQQPGTEEQQARGFRSGTCARWQSGYAQGECARGIWTGDAVAVSKVTDGFRKPRRPWEALRSLLLIRNQVALEEEVAIISVDCKS
jgi:hypothetical protein